MTRKLVTLLLALAMVLAMVPTMAETADLEPVTLDWYFGQAEMPDCAKVNDAVNEYLTEKINAKVNLHYWSGGDYWDRMRTMIGAGQDVGVIGFGSQTALDYVVESQRGAYYPLEELLDQYGQGTKALFNEGVWNCMTINDHIYGIPALKDNGYFISLIYNKTMADELGIDMSNYHLKNFRDIEPLAAEVKEKRDAAHPEWADRPVISGVDRVHPYYFAIENFLNDSFYAVCNIPGMEELAGVDCDTVTNLYATPEFEAFAVQKQDMVEKNLYAYDYTDRSEWNYDGGNFAWVGWGYTYAIPNLYGDKFQTDMIMFDNIWTDTNNYYSAGTAISANCANPERAMMMLELVNTDPFFATMMRFGIEGEHWTTDAEGKMTFNGTENEKADERTYYHWYMAPIGNLTIVNAPESLTGPDGIMLTEMARLNAECTQSAHMGFVFNNANVVNEIAALTNIESQYKADLINGTLADADEVKEILAEFNDELAANGVDKVIAEIQAQIDAWKAAR